MFPHDEFAPIIGDVIHNLRDALDLAVSVIMRNAEESGENVMFPTADSLYDFGPVLARVKKLKFPQSLIDMLETRIEPYTRGRGNYLRVLHKLAITDKHRMIVPTIFGTSRVAMNTEGMKLPFYTGLTPLPIKDGGIYARVLVSEFPDVKPNEEAEVTLTISFDSWEATKSVPIEDGLRRLYQATEEALDTMRACL